jgi:two-component sensor histidine kinase
VQCRAELNLLRKKCKEKDALLRELGDRLAASEASVQAFRDLQAREDGDRAAETKRHSESRLKE